VASLEFRSADQYSLAELAALLAESFEGYAVHIPFSVPLLLGLMRTEGTDLGASRVVCEDGQPVGISVICRRGSESRLGPFGIVTACRGRGLGQALLDRIIADAKERGDNRVLLEVIEGNDPAVRLYAGRGFRQVRRLVGYHAASVPPRDGKVEEVSIREAALLIGQHGFDDLPWPQAPETIGQMASPTRAFRMGPSLAILHDSRGADVILRSILTEPGARRQGHARRLIQALAAIHPEKPWKIPPICPEECTEALLAPLGFVREPLAQLQMSLDLIAS